ncbi:hypothetical protein SELMODRAFT_137556 [Selaginella moellendorffii]|uniref:Methyltransferase type 11 domain-containing protein n=1 Tax=Selaginella moellendorffii TaxID=88036 RepID=D8TDV5_SELML|nr:uncharacterized protein LOC9638484 isoform X2 [Selaginella moellendorffii]EFJ05194.1 hypothetical protein SELMODRAFT_137556 [Selaginella moellendorffii]|eukprot:XP_002993775.1 uncharacterized protein LOC9638484 isoform X2 [Selaginella moellendorffii]
MSSACVCGVASIGRGDFHFQLRGSSRLSHISRAVANDWRRGPYEEGALKQPRYSGDEPLSRLVSGLISIGPLFAAMQFAGRQVFLRTAEKKGIPWRSLSSQILNSEEIRAEKELVENKSIVYPEYYLQKFHAYTKGNLCWEAASEAEVATMSMVRRTLPAAETTEEALEVLRGNWIRALESYHSQNSVLPVSQVLDVGCSVGLSTIYLAEAFPSAQVTGLDLSPYFLAVAQHKEKQRIADGKLQRNPIRWRHANGEHTGFPSCTFDIVSIAYVIHECAVHATKGLLKEAYRILKPGGTIAITDNSPKSKILQSLPPVLFTLQKSTEPWLDDYYGLDLEEAMREAGFICVCSRLTNPRHRTVNGTVPLAGKAEV